MDFEESFESYFGKTDIIKNNPSAQNNKIISKHTENRLRSEGNVHNIRMAGELIGHLLNAAWGNKWGSFVPAYSRSKATLPIITYRIVSRENSIKTPIKSKKLDLIDEVIDGTPTGDVFEEFFKVQDCIVEFDFYGENSSSAEELSERFEEVIELYIGQLKRLGISEMYFVKEVPPEDSYEMKNSPHKTLIYFLEIQKFNMLRQSTIKNIKIQLKESLLENNYISDDKKVIETDNNSFIYNTDNRLQ